MDRELFLSALQIGPEDTYVSGKWFFIRLLLAALAAAVHELRCSRAIYGLNHRQHRFWLTFELSFPHWIHQTINI